MATEIPPFALNDVPIDLSITGAFPSHVCHDRRFSSQRPARAVERATPSRQRPDIEMGPAGDRSPRTAKDDQQKTSPFGWVRK